MKTIFWALIIPIAAFYLGTLNPKIVTKTETVTQTIQLPAPKTYICNTDKDNVDFNSCFEIDYTRGTGYCFDKKCSYIYTDKELK